MNALSLLLIGGGVYYFATKKKTPASTSTKKFDDSIKIGSKEIGYQIIDCKKLTIFDPHLAFDHAFKLGADNTKPDYNGGNNYDTDVLRAQLLGVCANTELALKGLLKTKTDALFIFDLMKFLYSGIASKSIAFDKPGVLALEKLKKGLNEILGFDVSDFKVELVKKA